ncbi:MAG: flagellar hook protein FlgE [Deltaproteobacteria bacterium]|nr:flagellar hook protein FlgE [Deltaproteobacteria bacterium]
MSLTSSLFSGISGLSTLGNSMTVIGDNIANINTVGFKGSRVTFQDVLSQTVATTAGTAQVGRGTSLADITANFSQGSFESTSSATDLAIGGDGFFIVRDPNSSSEFYTRAGEFRLDKDGNFTNPEGYIVRGWALDAVTGEDTGSITDIVLQSFTSSPKETDLMTLAVNLDADATSKVASLSNAWDGSASTPLAAGAYEYQSTLKAYDTLGSTHDVSIYFDKKSSTNWEYIITSNPAEDKRTFVDTAETTTVACTAGSTLAGGEYFNISSPTVDYYVWYTVQGVGVDPAAANVGKTAIPVVLLTADTDIEVATKIVAEIDALGAFGAANAAGASATITITNAVDGEAVRTADGGSTSATGFTITETIRGGLAADHPLQGLLARGELTFDTSGNITDVDQWTTNTATGAISAQVEGTDTSSNGYFDFTTEFIAGSTQDIEVDFGIYYSNSAWVKGTLATSQFASASNTAFQSANGYGAGDLQAVSVATDGAITGKYSNGEVIPLYRVGLAKFQNYQDLYKRGGNLYEETRNSGNPITGKPGSSGLGSISPNSLEQSNVDIAEQFVKMITTQRGFQANSKIITVTDQMLAELIQLKR